MDRSHFDKTKEILDNDSLAGLSVGQQERLAIILDSYLAKLESGEFVDSARILAANSDLAEVLREYLVSIDGLHQLPTNEQRPTSDPRPAVNLAVPNDGLVAAQGQLGDYIIRGEIGRGGMGVVYEADQVSLGRRVALKTLPFTSVLDPKQVTRFKNEAQAAAGLHHPHIVPVYGVGSERGIHYYSMQLIEGQSLAEVISELRGSTQVNDVLAEASNELDRVDSNQTTVANCFTTCKSVNTHGFIQSVAEIGRQAAEALHYAHEHGVVHRDIKPSNLMLDGESQLWITDFGLARIGGTANITVSGDLVGTARYMSPEQAGSRLHEIDHRSDVFSLGATLYELLTLEPAFDGDSRQQLLRSVESLTPTSPRRINPAIPVDLETVIIKSLEKRRDDRYASAGDFAEDLANFLHGRPTKAQRPTPLEHIYRWVDRHRRVVAASVSAMMVLLIVVSGAAMLLSAAQQRTEQESKRARENLSETLRVVDNFGARVDGRLEHIAGTQRLRLDLLLELEKFYSRFLDQSKDDPLLDYDLATTRFRLAAVQQRLGQYSKARMGYERALNGFERLRVIEPNGDDRIADVALCHNNIGQVADQQGEFRVAINAYKLAISGYRQLVDDESPRGRLGLARSSMNLGLLLAKESDPEAAQVLDRTLESLTVLASDFPDDVRIQDQLALCENNLASVVLTNDPSRAESLLRRAVKRYDDLSKKRPASPEHRSDQALAIGNLAAVISRNGEREQALMLFEEVVKIRSQLVEVEPEVLAHAVSLAATYQQRGQLLTDENPAAAADEYRFAEDVLRNVLKKHTNRPRANSDLARVLGNLAVLASRQNQPQQASEYAREAIQSQQTALKLTSPEKQFKHTILLDAMVERLSQYANEPNHETLQSR